VSSHTEYEQLNPQRLSEIEKLNEENDWKEEGRS
jgi:hypothetical protein